MNGISNTNKNSEPIAEDVESILRLVQYTYPIRPQQEYTLSIKSIQTKTTKKILSI